MSDQIAFDGVTQNPIPFKILQGPHILLETPCQAVNEITEEFVAFGRKLLYTLMSTQNGIGLAAPQVGASFRVIAMAVPTCMPTVLFNPEIIDKSWGSTKAVERCLSYAKEEYVVTRRKWVTVRYTEMTGKVITRKMRGLEARVLQHEMMHLDGVNFREQG